MAEIATQQAASEWYRIITDWPNFWANFQKNFQGLLAQSAWVQKRPSLLPEYESNVRKGSELYNKLLAVNNSVNGIKSSWSTFTGWLQGTFGMSGLGLLPAIPVAIGAATTISLIAGATFLLKTWSELGARYLIIQQEEARGATPEQALRKASSIVGAPGEPGTFFGINIKWILIGAAALLILPSVLPMLRKK